MTNTTDIEAEMDRESLPARVIVAFTKRVRALGAVQAAGLELQAAERAASDAKNAILLKHPEPKTLGSNEAIRDAAVRGLCASENERVDKARAAMAVATLDLQMIDDTIRMLRELRIILIGPDGGYRN